MNCAPSKFPSKAGPTAFSKVPDLAAPAIIPNMREGHIWIDTTTSRPEVSERLATRLAERGAIFADAPVTGGPKQ
ncbi:MAG: NAD(P)-binding domain-containing protein, partial [Pseudomonadota bacterium]